MASQFPSAVRSTTPGWHRLPIILGAVAAGIVVVGSVAHFGLHGMRLAAFMFGVVAFGAAIGLVKRALRRRARLEAIAELLPSYRPRPMEDEFLLDEGDLDDDHSGHLPAGRAEMRAATRALLVSLEEEMRREVGRARRSGRPACRHARLRIAGRSEARRRRVPVRIATSAS
ncbi:MAG: hypothetical protein ABJA82_19540 [Myxococcales bacterium]